MENWKKQLNEAWQRITEYQLGDEAPYEITELFSSLLQEQRQRMAKEIEGKKKDYIVPKEDAADSGEFDVAYDQGTDYGFNSGLQAALNIVLGEGEKQ